ncbi:20169_t:CDS:2 [Cetraspora pellucida]|uniref:20169_t:CDS:1 n=1 Tax=Cetraspora pellucida TaxID=1433469 RepID=A0A9N9JHA1_9GLOM|nr:20169_t:CDS:2 [Cetraspora pellucida]
MLRIPRVSSRYDTITLAAVSLFIFSWFAAIYLAKPEDYVPDMSRGLTLIFGIAFIIMALVYLFGIIGSFFEISIAVRVFSNMLWGFVIVNIVIAIVVIANIIQNRQHEIDNCIEDLSTSLESDMTFCTHYKTMIIIRNVVVEILLILFSVLIARVSSVYARQLKRIIPTTSLNPHTNS